MDLSEAEPTGKKIRVCRDACARDHRRLQLAERSIPEDIINKDYETPCLLFIKRHLIYEYVFGNKKLLSVYINVVISHAVC